MFFRLSAGTLVIVALLSIIAPASAQGPLRRLFQPRVRCVPAPICMPIEALPEPTRAGPWGSLEGRVTFRGELPKIKNLVGKHDPDNSHPPIDDDFKDPTWRIDPRTRGVANVCVYLKRPKDGVLPIHPDDRVRKGDVAIDTPTFRYVPHMVAVYPEWFDGKERGKTGQSFVIKNSSIVVHSSRAMGQPDRNPGFSVNFVPKSLQKFDLLPQSLPLAVEGDLHPWMRAYAWVFDHPYFAITKEDGTFTIPRVPAGVEVHVMAWHESQGWLFTKNGKAMTLKSGKNTLDFEIGVK